MENNRLYGRLLETIVAREGAPWETDQWKAVEVPKGAVFRNLSVGMDDVIPWARWKNAYFRLDGVKFEWIS